MQIILAILNRSLPLAARFELHVHNHPFPSLTVMGLGSGPRGLPAISVFQHRCRDAAPLRHPEMRFEVEFQAGSAVELLPFCWRSDYAEIEEYSVFRDGAEPNGKSVLRIDAKRLADQRCTALEWNVALAAQGFERAWCHAWHLDTAARIAHA